MFLVLFAPTDHPAFKNMLVSLLATTSVITMCRVLCDLRMYSAQEKEALVCGPGRKPSEVKFRDPRTQTTPESIA